MILTILSLVWGGLSKFFMGLFTFFTTKPGCYVGIALLVIAAFWYTDHRAYNRGVAYQQDVDTKQRLIAERDAYVKGLAMQQKLDKGLASVEYNAGLAKGLAEAKTVTLIKEIPKYVTVETDRTFPLPCGLLRLHDAAASGAPAASISLPTGYADDKACPTQASVLATIITENYGLYHQAEAQIAGLQALARTLAETISGVKVSSTVGDAAPGQVATDGAGFRAGERELSHDPDKLQKDLAETESITQGNPNELAQNLHHQPITVRGGL